MQTRALEGIRVVDLTQFEAGPVATLTLAQMGAEVIKIERPTFGEQGRMGSRSFRGKTPPGGDTIHFSLLNMDKKSVTLNLKEEAGKSVLRRLLVQSDVVVENYSPGTMEKLGFGWETLQEINPRLIYGEIKGFPVESPYGGYPCFDGVAQAMGVVCSITGNAGGPPMQSGANLADNLSGIYLAQAVTAALFQRERTGRGQHVRVNMQEVLIHTCRGAFVEQIDAGRETQRFGNVKFPNRAPINMYRCKPRDETGQNDYVFLYVSPMPGSPQWTAFCGIIGRPAWIDDPVMGDPNRRAERRDELDAAITAWTEVRDKDEVMRAFCEADVPCGAVLGTRDVMEGAAYRASGTVVEVDHPTLGRYDTLGSPWHMSDSPYEAKPSPTLGQHNDEVYRDLLKLDDDELSALRADGVI